MLAARSVHGLGMREALGVVSLDPDGAVRRAGVLSPARLFWDRGACWVIELPPGRPLPPPGMVLRAVRRGPCRRDPGGRIASFDRHHSGVVRSARGGGFDLLF